METSTAFCARCVRSLPVRLACCALAALAIIAGACLYAGAYWLEGGRHAA
jgi:hypothetical protein